MTTIWAYGDETGDRGLSPTASPIFGMAFVVGDEQTMAAVRAAVLQLRADFNVPNGAVMSWKKHLKQHERRLQAAKVLGRIPNLVIVYGVSRKADLASGSFTREDKKFYDFVAAKLHRSVLWAGRAMHADAVRIRYGRVRHVDHGHTLDYIRRMNGADSKVPMHLEKELSWVGADKHLESEAADIYAGFMKMAFWPDAYGNVDDGYLKRIWHQVRRNPNGCAVPLGMFTMPHYGVIFDQEWFSCQDCPAQSRYRAQGPSIFADLGLRK